MWRSDWRTGRNDKNPVHSRSAFSASASLRTATKLFAACARGNARHRLPRVPQAARTSARHVARYTALRKGTISTFAPRSFALGAALMPQTASFHQAHRRQALTTREVLDSRAPLSVLCRYFCVTYIVRHHHKVMHACATRTNLARARAARSLVTCDDTTTTGSPVSLSLSLSLCDLV